MQVGFSGGASGKEPASRCKGHKGSGFNPWLRKILWKNSWQLTPGFSPGDPMDRGAWQATVHRVAKSQIQLKLLSMHLQFLIWHFCQF